MEISSKGIYEINIDGNTIKLIYNSVDDALAAMYVFRKKQFEEMNKVFPNGVF